LLFLISPPILSFSSSHPVGSVEILFDFEALDFDRCRQNLFGIVLDKDKNKEPRPQGGALKPKF